LLDERLAREMAAELAEEERVKAAKAAAEAAELKAAEEAKLKAEREREAALSAARNAREKRGKMRNQQWVAVVDKPTRSDVVTAAGANPSGSAPQAPPAPPRAGATVTSTPPLDRNRDDGHPERGPAEAAVETREGTGSESNGSQLPVCSLDSEPQRLALLSPEEREKERVQASHGRVVWAVARMLTRQGSDGPFSGVLALPRARVPIVKFKHDPSGISCDLGVNNRLAVVNSRLLATYLAADPRARPLVLLVKHWAKCRKINDPYRGTLSSYAYVLLVVHFLQTQRPAVLPCLQREAQPGEARVLIDGFDCTFADPRQLGFSSQNSANLARLFVLFFPLFRI